MNQKKIDAHAHFGHSFNAWSDKYPTLDEIMRMYDEYGITKSCISHWLIVYDPAEGNKRVLEAVRRFPDRLIGFAVVAPRCGKSAVDELDRCINDYGMKGLKAHPSAHEFYADSKLMDPIMERAVKYDVPILLHSDPGKWANPRLIGNLAGRFPEAKILIGHMSGADWLEAIWVAKEHKNVYLDTTNMVTEFLALATAVEECGDDRIVWGTDLPGLLIGAELAKVTHARIPESSKEKILYENMARVLDLKT